MKGYDEQYNCLLKFNVRDDYNSAKRVRDRNRDVLNIRDIHLKRAEEAGRLADPGQEAANREFIRNYAFDNLLDIEEDAIEYLAVMFTDKRFAKLRVKLERLVDKEFGYSHLRDLAVVVMSDIYFEHEFYTKYATISNMVREKSLTLKVLIRQLGVSEYPFRHVMKLDYIFNMYLQDAFALTIDEVEKTLFSLAIDDREFKAVSYVLSNLRSDKFKGQYSADLNVTRSEADIALDGLSADELAVMFNKLSVEIDEEESGYGDTDDY